MEISPAVNDREKRSQSEKVNILALAAAAVRRWNVLVSFWSGGEADEKKQQLEWEIGEIRCCSKQCRRIIHIQATFVAYKWKNMLSSSHFSFALPIVLPLATVNRERFTVLLPFGDEHSVLFALFSLSFSQCIFKLWHNIMIWPFLNAIKYVFCLYRFIRVDTKSKWESSNCHPTQKYNRTKN